MNTAACSALLVCGLHSNEAAAPIVARRVRDILADMPGRVDLFDVPSNYSALATLDGLPDADSRYCLSGGTGQIDFDLEDLIREEMEKRGNPLTFEFHNISWTWDRMAISPGMKPEEFEIGPVAPNFIRPYQIATWKNTGGLKQYLVELPAVYQPVGPEILQKRTNKLRQLEQEGRSIRKEHMVYLEKAVDVNETSRRGFTSPVIAQKVAGWIGGEVESHCP